MSEVIDCDADALPGYRRAIRVEPEPGQCTVYLEDDFHCMAVSLTHDGDRVVAIEAFTDRVPWSTCPGAVAKLVATFEGRPLAEVTAREDKKNNCTHLHDMAVLAAAHAGDDVPLRFDIAASDPQDNVRILEGRRDGRLLHRWVERNGTIVEPKALKGQTLFTLRDWIGRLEGEEQELARLLQWGSIVAHGRNIPPEEQQEASALPANCYTLQPERAIHAKRTGVSYDFSGGSRAPLAGLRDRMLSARSRPRSTDHTETPV